jgi:hypothetical protein
MRMRTHDAERENWVRGGHPGHRGVGGRGVVGPETLEAPKVNVGAKSTGWILAESKPKRTPKPFTWDEGERKFRDRFGRNVSRKDVRESLDRYVDNLQAEVEDITGRMVAGDVDVDQWQRQMASVIKRGHVAAMSIAKGGREQVTQSDWGRTAQIVRTQYDYLYPLSVRATTGGREAGPRRDDRAGQDVCIGGHRDL